MFKSYLFRPTETDAGYADSLDNKKVENSDIASVQNSLNVPGNRHSENYCNHSKEREMLYQYLNKHSYFFSPENLNPVAFFHRPERLTTAISPRLKCIKILHIAAAKR